MKKITKLEQSKDRKTLSWAQAKWKYPKLKPMGDWDNDGVKNQFDCRPMNRKMQHVTMKHDSEWKTKMIEDFPTVEDLKRFAEEKGDKE